MHEEVEVALRTALERVLGALQAHPQSEPQLQLIWRGNEGGGWTGAFQDRPMPPMAMHDVVNWEEEAVGVRESFRRNHPGYLGMVGTDITGYWDLDAGHLLQVLVGEIWRRHGRFAMDGCWTR